MKKRQTEDFEERPKYPLCARNRSKIAPDLPDDRLGRPLIGRVPRVSRRSRGFIELRAHHAWRDLHPPKFHILASFDRLGHLLGIFVGIVLRESFAVGLSVRIAEVRMAATEHLEPVRCQHDFERFLMMK